MSTATRSEWRRPGSAGLIKLLCATILFAYLGFILAVLLSDVFWLARPSETEAGSSGLARVLGKASVLAELKYSIVLTAVTSIVTSVLAMGVAIPGAYVLSRCRIPLRP